MGSPLVDSLAVIGAPVLFIMELREIFTTYCAHLRNNFYPVDDPTAASKTVTTSDLMQEIEMHFGELGTDDYPVDRSVLVQTLTDLGFKAIMMPGTTEMRWLLAEKR